MLAPLLELIAALRAMRRRTGGLALAYLALAFTLLAGAAALIDALGPGIRRWLQAFLLPDEASPLADLAVDLLFAAQSRALTTNLTATAGLALVSLFLFFVKEALSRAVERDREARLGLSPAPFAHLPWWRELAEELGLVAIYAALFLLVLALGQTVSTPRRELAVALSHLVLAWTWAVDFLALPLFRRRITYRGTFALIARHPLRSLLFGALASLPILGAVALADALALEGASRLLLIVTAQALVIIAATLSGTRLALTLLAETRAPEDLTQPMARPLRALAIAGVALTLLGGAWVSLSLGRAALGTSQVLKCRYALAPGSLDLSLPELDPLAWLSGEPIRVGFTATLRIDNPTEVDLDLADSRLVIRDGDLPIAESHLGPLRAPARGSATQRLALSLAVSPLAFTAGASIDPRAWSLALHVRLDSGLDFPIPLRVP